MVVLCGTASAVQINVNQTGWWNETGDTTFHEINPCQIQAAIANATAGDTVYVCSGSYYEYVIVNKRLTLRGIDTGEGKPVVDAGGIWCAITLDADGCILQGFNTTNSGSVLNHAGIRINSNNNTITNNNADYNNYYGIILLSSSNNTLINNSASYNYYGIYLSSSCDNMLSDNNVMGNGNFEVHYGAGIMMTYSSNNKLSGNSVSNNLYGIRLSYSCNNMLSSNDVNSNKFDGIVIYPSSNNNTLSGNNVSYNSHGMKLDSSSNNNTLSGNNASFNGWGIYLASSNNNTLISNKVMWNYYNIYLLSSKNNTLISNNVLSTCYGIVMYSSSSNLIYNNYFNNTNNAYDDGVNTWNITKTAGINIIGGSWLGGNYWSDYAGEDTNGDYLGDTMLPYNSMITNDGDYLPLVHTQYAKGDLNHDDNITSADAAIALQLAASGEYDPAADVSGDNHVTSLDALMILQAAAGGIGL